MFYFYCGPSNLAASHPPGSESATAPWQPAQRIKAMATRTNLVSLELEAVGWRVEDGGYQFEDMLLADVRCQISLRLVPGSVS